MSRRKRREPRSSLVWAIGLAVLIHLASVPLLTPLIPKPSPYDAKPRKVSLVTLASSVPKLKPPKLRKQPESEPAENKPKPEPEPENLEGQVVDLPPSPDDTPPEDAKYLSEYNTRTERETVSRHQAQRYANAMNERTVARRSEIANPNPPQKQATALEVGPESERKPTEQKQGGQELAFELPNLKQRDRLALKLDPEFGDVQNRRERVAMEGNSRRLKLSIGDDQELSERGTAPKQAPQVADLVPNLGVLARLDGAPANDHLDGLDEGEGTFLNSKEFKFASFFNRMKRGVSQHWDPLTEYRRRDPTGNIYGYRSRVTVLSVTLHPDGSLKTVEVQRSSGIDFLDREAVSAFQRAQPFPNPPRGLVNEGVIEFPFGFHVDFSRPGGLRLPF